MNADNTKDSGRSDYLPQLITEHTDTLDEISKQHLQNYVQKLANATHIFFTERAILREQIRFLRSKRSPVNKFRDCWQG
jgi:hypothetical protein